MWSCSNMNPFISLTAHYLTGLDNHTVYVLLESLESAVARWWWKGENTSCLGTVQESGQHFTSSSIKRKLQKQPHDGKLSKCSLILVSIFFINSCQSILESRERKVMPIHLSISPFFTAYSRLGHRDSSLSRKAQTSLSPATSSSSSG